MPCIDRSGVGSGADVDVFRSRSEAPYVKQVIYRIFRFVFVGQPHDLIALPVIGMDTYSVACDLTNWSRHESAYLPSSHKTTDQAGGRFCPRRAILTSSSA